MPSVSYDAGESSASTSVSGAITDFPITIAGWVYFNSFAGSNAAIFSYSQIGASNQYIVFRETNTSGAWDVNHRSGPNNVIANSGGNLATGTWIHLAFRAGSATDKEIYSFGFSRGTDTSNDTFINSPDTVCVNDLGSSSSFEASGNSASHAHWAIWNADMSASEILALAAGVHPLNVRPGNIWGYWPLYGASYLHDYGPNQNPVSDNIVGTLADGASGPLVQPYWGPQLVPMPASSVPPTPGNFVTTGIRRGMGRGMPRQTVQLF